MLRRQIDMGQITATPADLAFNGLSNLLLGALRLGCLSCSKAPPSSARRRTSTAP